MPRLSITLDERTAQRVAAAAQAQGISQSAWLNLTAQRALTGPEDLKGMAWASLVSEAHKACGGHISRSTAEAVVATVVTILNPAAPIA